MKKVLFTLALFVFIASNGRAQVFGSQMYEVNKMYLPALDMQIGFYYDVYKPKHIYYDLKSSNSRQLVQARIHTGTQYANFIANIKNAKKTYEKWTKVAKEEGTRLFSKRIPVYVSDQTMYFTDGNNWYCEEGVDIQLRFFVDEQGNCQFVIQTDRMTSEEVVSTISPVGSFYKDEVAVKHECSGASLSFQSSEEIDKFIETLESVMSSIKQQKSQKSKFR